MPGATVIDQLIVKLGLDPKDFDKGRKRAAAEVVSLEKDVKKSSAGMSASIVGFTGKILGIATAAIAVKKTIGYVSELSTTVRQLGIDSRNFGIAAAEMRNFQNIGEMFGGKGEEVTRTIGGITKAVYDLAYNGQISDSLIMLGRLGVKFQDTAGNARSFRDIVLDTEQKIQQSMRNGTSRENANQMLLQAGFDPGLAQAILSGNVAGSLAQQENRKQATSDIVDAATAWEKSATNRSQAIDAAALRGLPAAAEAGTMANNKIAAMADSAGTDSLGEIIDGTAEGVKEAGKNLVDALSNIYDRIEHSGVLFPKGRANYENTIQQAAARHGIDPELLAGVLDTESKFNPSAVSPAGARGIAQLMPKYFPDAGKNPHEDIDTAAAYLSALHVAFMKDGNDSAAANVLALQSYNAGQSRVRKAADGGRPLAQETLDYPGKVLSYAAGSGGQSSSTVTEVSIGKVDVHTQASDAEGIATDFAGATRRKIIAAQSETGMN